MTEKQRANLLRLVGALESGQYKQHRGAMCVPHEDGGWAYCVAGLMCELSGLGRWDKGTENGCRSYVLQGVKLAHMPPGEVVRHYVDTVDDVGGPAVLGKNEGGYTEYVINANDNGATFPELAAMIRRRYGL